MDAASVGILIGVRHENNDAVILSVRAKTKLEDGDFKPQSYAGACQLQPLANLKRMSFRWVTRVLQLP